MPKVSLSYGSAAILHAVASGSRFGFDIMDVTGLTSGTVYPALDRLESGRRPSLILLDLKMPVMDGWGFCEALGADERFASIPVAILTASAIYDSLPQRRNGAGLFTKPVDFQRLLSLVRRFCG